MGVSVGVGVGVGDGVGVGVSVGSGVGAGVGVGVLVGRRAGRRGRKSQVGGVRVGDSHAVGVVVRDRQTVAMRHEDRAVTGAGCGRVQTQGYGAAEQA